MPTYFNRRPAFETSVRRYIEGELLQVHVAIPAVVEAYDPDKQWADVQPLLYQAYLDENDQKILLPYPVIPNVPVQFPRGGNFFITWPLQQGDPVTLVVSQRSLDNWKTSDGKTILDPQDTRHHHLSDAIAIPGGATALNAIALSNSSDLVIGMTTREKAEIHMRADGRIWLTTAANGAGSPSAGDALVRQSDLNAVVESFNSHGHVGNLGAPTSGPLLGPLGPIPPTADPGYPAPATGSALSFSD